MLLLTIQVPYFFRRWVRMDKSARLEPLYHFEDDVSTSSSERGSIHNDKATEAVHQEDTKMSQV